MTDKTPQNPAETLVNNPTTLAGTTDTTRDSEPKNRALLPQANALKARFKAGSIPLQTDFADLIDLANMGRQAVGGAEGQTGPANGFTLSSTGRLELKPNAAKGISVDPDGVAIKVGKGIKVDKDGVYLPLGWGLRHGGDGLDLSCKTNGGLRASTDGTWVISGQGITVDSTGVGVKSGNGVAVNSSGVNIKLAKGNNTNGGEGQGTDGATSGSCGGLNLTEKGLSIDAGDGVQINTRGVSIKLAANSGLSADETNGLKVVPEQQFQKGMIMMFSGTGIPSGWALCDGNNGTPNLVDRFIIGGKGSDVGKAGGQSLTGSGDNKTYTVNTNTVSAGKIDVSISGTALAAKHIPPHTHNVKYTWNTGSGSGGYTVTSVANAQSPNIERRDLVDAYGNSAETHTHSGTASQGTHGHTINSLPAYYVLAFIMKL